LYGGAVSCALLLGGTGQIGVAAAVRLRKAGWEVMIAARSGPIRVDRREPGQLEKAVGEGVDAIVDVVAYTRADGEQLNALGDRVGSLVVISSASVYADAEGRTLDEASSLETFPRLAVPIAESEPTVAPSDATYSAQKVALEQTVLDGPVPTTIIRPCAVHGRRSTSPREWFFVKRVRDGRRHVVLVSRGQSRFHTTSVDNLAELIRLALENPADRILNCGDPNPPTVAEIGRAVAPELEQVPIDEDGYTRRDLSNPWAVPYPIVVDTTNAERELGYRPVADYRDAVQATRDWLLTTDRDFSDTYLTRYFDYAAEDEFIRSAHPERGAHAS
jgi:nucleoside-diphosphate-sugar epimerase